MTRIAARYILPVSFVILLLGAEASFSSPNPSHIPVRPWELTTDDCMGCHSEMKRGSGCQQDYCLSDAVYPPKGKEDAYAPLGLVEEAGCVLEDGEVSCLSCHDVTKPRPHLIKQGFALCRVCHLTLTR